MSDTEKNLKEAFAGESQANRRYLFFADKADKEGHPQIAKLFRAAAESETVHARNHFTAMDGQGSTQDNLMAGIMGEHYEFTRMYPVFIDKAEEEGDKKAQRSFEYANEVEQIHHSLYETALKTLKAGKQLKSQSYYVCQVCGNTVEGEAPEICPICGNPRSAFKRVD
ncbi:MAG: rubrerythrin family protein [Chloroflexi bacterium]|nr:rubrerythrin family protein [Chloroflexota bacterium]